MPSAEYRVRLEAFEGPLDLLLHLIRRAEVEIADIPVATIAEQYLDHLARLDDVDIENAGEFLVMAATLMEIKSRLLAPRDEDDGDEGDSGPGDLEDPRADLVRQLLAYKRARDRAEALRRRRDRWALRFPAGRAAHDRAALLEAAEHRREQEIEDPELYDLVEAYARLGRQVDLDRLGDHHVAFEDDDTPIEVHQDDIVGLLRSSDDDHGLPLRRVFRDRRRVEIVGLFVALLELVRQRRVRIEADESAEDVRILPPSPDDEDDAPSDDVAAPDERSERARSEERA